MQERDRGEHSRKRKYLAHAFALKTVVEMEPVIRANAMNLIARIEDFIDDMAGHTGGSSETFNVRAWLNYFTLDVIGDMAFGLPMGFLRAGSDAKPAQSPSGTEYTVPSMIKALHHGVRYSIVLAQITSLRLHGLIGALIGCSRYLSTRLGATDSANFENISLLQLQRRLDKGAPTDRPSRDFIGHIIADKAGTARDLPFGEMVAESVVMMNAGSDTTAAALTNTVFYLLSNPACLQKLREELQTADPAGQLHNDTVVKYEMQLEREEQELDVFERFNANPGALPVRIARTKELY